MKKKNIDVLKDEFKEAVLKVRPDAIIKDNPSVVILPETKNDTCPNVAALYVYASVTTYNVWHGTDWTDHDTLDAFIVDFKTRYGSKEESKDEPVKDDVHDTSNYHGVTGHYEPIKVMEYAHEQYLKRGLGADEALNLSLAIKYLLRVGTKDGKLQEMFKAENYIHRARTEEWIDNR